MTRQKTGQKREKEEKEKSSKNSRFEPGDFQTEPKNLHLHSLRGYAVPPPTHTSKKGGRRLYDTMLHCDNYTVKRVLYI